MIYIKLTEWKKLLRHRQELLKSRQLELLLNNRLKILSCGFILSGERFRYNVDKRQQKNKAKIGLRSFNSHTFFFMINSFKMHFFDIGSGKSLVILSGVKSNSVSWHSTISALSKLYRCIVMDQRGIGFTLSDSIYAINDIINDMELLFKTLMLSRFTIIAQSHGTIPAVNYTKNHLSNVDALILLSTNPLVFNDRNVIEDYLCRHQNSISNSMNTYTLSNSSGISKIFDVDGVNLLNLFIADFNDKIKLIAGRRSVTDHGIIGDAMLPIVLNSIGKDLNFIAASSIPVLVIQGEFDPVTNMIAMLWKYKFQIIKSGNHMFFIENPYETKNIILSFLHYLETRISYRGCQR